MLLTDEQAYELLARVAVAAMYYDPDHAILDDGATAYADVSRALEAIADVALTDDERDRLRVLCGRAVVDPTAYRADLTDLVLAAIPDTPADVAASE